LVLKNERHVVTSLFKIPKFTTILKPIQKTIIFEITKIKIPMKKLLFIFVLVVMAFTSCKKEETTDAAPTEEAVTEATAADSIASPATPQEQQATATTGDANSVMYNQPTTGSTVTAAPTPQPTQKVAKGMNPAHGQPGHRCDIEVGQPLNSPPGKIATPKQGAATVTQATTVTPAMKQLAEGATTTTTTPTTPVVTAPGMNPPHGQEGHDCAVPVGQPLPKK